jgi:hypothetical protein
LVATIWVVHFGALLHMRRHRSLTAPVEIDKLEAIVQSERIKILSVTRVERRVLSCVREVTNSEKVASPLIDASKKT